ncbi:Multidrug resistance protein 2 [Thermococcus barophilus]|uniref:Multidrug resistance protein 2 n=1 Tax=Thermococcus barophilus TaxID=55802 RepID=A0A0S1XAN1_THEBA|nr:Multidrug resistance protein 2 [Thermococcus barophilus]
MASSVLGPYLSLWLKGIGLGFSEIGLTQSVSEIAQLITDFPTGGVADRHGRVKTYAAGSSLFGIGLLIIGLTHTLSAVLVGATLSGFGMALVSGTLVPWLYDALNDRKSVQQTLGKLKAISGPVRFTGGVIGGCLASVAPNLPVLTAGMLSIASAIIALFLLPNNCGNRKAKYMELLRRGLREIRKNRALHLLLASSFFLSFTARAFFTFWMLLLVQRGLSREYLGVLFALLLLSTSAGGLIAQKLEPTSKTAAMLTVLLGTEIAMLGIIENLAISIALLFALEVTLSARFPVMAVLRNSFIPKEVRSTVTSAMSTVGSGFTAISNVMVGAFAEKLSLGKAYFIAGSLGMLAALPLLGLTFLSVPDERGNMPEKVDGG